MKFYEAMQLAGEGKKVRREAWGKFSTATIQSTYAVVFDKHGKVLETPRFLCRVDREGLGANIPFGMTDEDMAATDWVEL